MSDPDWYTKAKAEGRILSETAVKDLPSGITSRLPADPGKSDRKPAGKLIDGQTAWRDGWIEFQIPLRLEPVSNHGAVKKWLIGVGAKHRRAVIHRMAACIEEMVPFVRQAQNGRPLDCTITRIGRSMDDDNLASCAKMVRDAVALFCGVGDGPKDPIRWHYAQESRMVFGVKVRLELPTGPPKLADLPPLESTQPPQPSKTAR